MRVVQATTSENENQASLSQDLDKKRFSEDENNNTSEANNQTAATATENTGEADPPN